LGEKRSSNWARYYSLASNFAVAIVAFTLFGYWLDRRLGSYPWALLVGFGLGFAGGLYGLVREAVPRKRKSPLANVATADKPEEKE
jgi:F0F1-type ATP synthase assembly protein I